MHPCWGGYTTATIVSCYTLYSCLSKEVKQATPISMAVVVWLAARCWLPNARQPQQPGSGSKSLFNHFISNILFEDYDNGKCQYGA